MEIVDRFDSNDDEKLNEWKGILYTVYRIPYTAIKMTQQKTNNRIGGKIIVLKMTVSFDGIVRELERISVWMDGRKEKKNNGTS